MRRSRARSPATGNPSRGRSTLGEREPVAAQLLFEHGNAGGRVALVAIVDGGERREVRPQPAFAAGAAGVAARQGSELGAVGGIVALGGGRARQHGAGQQQQHKRSGHVHSSVVPTVAAARWAENLYGVGWTPI